MELNNNNFNKHGKENFASEYIQKKWHLLFLVAAAAVGCFLNSVNGEFVHDDVFAIKSNQDVTGKTPISGLFYNDFWGKAMTERSSHKSYRPLCVLSFRLNYQLGGGDPYWFHVVNVLLHAVMTCLFTYVCQEIIRLPYNLSLMAGLMFAAHPIHTEAVSGIVGRADILSGIFFMLSFTLYVKSLDTWWIWCYQVPKTQNPVTFIGSLICAAIAMLCKEHGIMVLPLCIMYDVLVCCRSILILYLERRVEFKSFWPTVRRIVILVTVLCGLLLFRLSMLHGHLPEFQVIDNPASFSPYLLTRCLTYSYIWMLNVWLLLAPSVLCYDWQVGSIPLVETLSDPRNLATAVFFIIIFALTRHCCLNLKRQGLVLPDVVLPALLLMVLPFLPASNLFFRVGFVLAERVLYIPSTGFCILVSYGVGQLIEKVKSHRRTVQCMFVVVLMLFVWKTYTQNLKWKSRESLFRWGITTMPNNAKVHYNFANYCKDIGDKVTAIHHYRKALGLYEDDVSSHNNLGTLLSNETEAERHYRQALQLRPDHKGAHVNLGSLLFKKGEKEAGIQLLQSALRTDPDYTEAQIVMASMLTDTGDFDGAEQLYHTAARQNPHSVYIMHQYATFLQVKGNVRESVKMFNTAFEMDPKHTASIVGAVKGLRTLGEFKQAESVLNKALSRVSDPVILDQLGLVYGQTGRTAAAVRLYQDILEHSPNNTDILMHYTQVLVAQKKYSLSEAIISRAVSLSPNDLDVLSRMSKILGLQGKHQEALPYLSHAINVAEHSQNKQMLSDLLYQLGNHQKDLKLFPEAAKNFEKSLALDSSRTLAYMNLGALHHLMGDYKKARHCYNKALTHEPDNEIAILNLKKLKNLESLSSQKRINSN